MKTLTLVFSTSAALLLSLFILGCGKKDHAHSHAGHDHGHAHAAPHGGTLVELGDHIFNLELVHDAEAGKLVAYVLDSHAENFVRVALEALPVNLTVDGQAQTLTLRPVANPSTGETVGNTAQFEAAAPWLQNARRIEGRIERVIIRGRTFSDLRFELTR